MSAVSFGFHLRSVILLHLLYQTLAAYLLLLSVHCPFIVSLMVHMESVGTNDAFYSQCCKGYF